MNHARRQIGARIVNDTDAGSALMAPLAASSHENVMGLAGFAQAIDRSMAPQSRRLLAVGPGSEATGLRSSALESMTRLSGTRSKRHRVPQCGNRAARHRRVL